MIPTFPVFYVSTLILASCLNFHFAKVWCKTIVPTPTTHPSVPAPSPKPASIPTTSAVVKIPTPPSSATQTEGPVTNSPPQAPPPTITATSTQVEPATNSDTTSSAVDNASSAIDNTSSAVDNTSSAVDNTSSAGDNQYLGNGDGPTNSSPGSSVLPSSTNQFKAPFGSDPAHGTATGSGAHNTGSSVPALSSNASKGSDVGAIVGAILGTIFFILVLFLLVRWLIRRRKKGHIAPSAEFLASPGRPFTRSPQFQRIGSTYET